MDIEEFLRFAEANPDARYEYFDGQVLTLEGATSAQSTIATSIACSLRNKLRKGSCRAYNSASYVMVAEKRLFLPDVTVTCDSNDNQGQTEIIRYPRVIVEVLSSDTECYDRNPKFAAYQECLSIQDYALVDSRCQCVEVYHRQGISWLYRRFMPDQDVEFPSLNVTLAFADIYDLTDVPAAKNDQNE